MSNVTELSAQIKTLIASAESLGEARMLAAVTDQLASRGASPDELAVFVKAVQERAEIKREDYK